MLLNYYISSLMQYYFVHFHVFFKIKAGHLVHDALNMLAVNWLLLKNLGHSMIHT